MKNFITKIFAALFCFIVGISAFYLISSICLSAPFDTSDSIMPNLLEMEIHAEPKKALSNKVEIRFVRFVEEDSYVEAEFEITNGTAEAVYYRGAGKNFYAFPTLKRDGKILPDNRFRCGTGLTEQKLSSGETVLFRVAKREITYDPSEDWEYESDKPTQVGFSFEMGDKAYIRIGEKQKEIFWSEAIKFPN